MLNQLLANHARKKFQFFSGNLHRLLEKCQYFSGKIRVFEEDIVIAGRHCEERFLRRGNPGFDLKSKVSKTQVRTWIAASQKALLAMTGGSSKCASENPNNNH